MTNPRRSMLYVLSTVGYLLFFTTSTVKAQHQDSCYDILRGGVFDKVHTLNRSNYASKLQTAFCAYLEQAQYDSTGVSLGATIPIEGIPVPFNGGYDEARVRTLKEQFCGFRNHEVRQEQLQEAMRSIASKEIASRWSQCMADKNKAPELVFELIGADEMDFGLRFRWGAAANVNTVRVQSFEVKNAACSHPLKRGNQISTGWLGVLCSRNSESKLVSITLNVVDIRDSLDGAPVGSLIKQLSPILPLPQVAFVSSAKSIEAGQKITLSWDVQNAQFVSLDPGRARLEPSGTYEDSPREDTTYKLTAFGPGGSAVRTISVKVTQPPARKPAEPVFEERWVKQEGGMPLIERCEAIRGAPVDLRRGANTAECFLKDPRGRILSEQDITLDCKGIGCAFSKALSGGSGPHVQIYEGRKGFKWFRRRQDGNTENNLTETYIINYAILSRVCVANCP